MTSKNSERSDKALSDVPTSKLLKPGEASKARNVTQASETFELKSGESGGCAWLF